jgi:hypothetical protein
MYFSLILEIVFVAVGETSSITEAVFGIDLVE